MRSIITVSAFLFLAASCSRFINPVVLESSDIIIPADGGTFYFQMKYHETTHGWLPLMPFKKDLSINP